MLKLGITGGIGSGKSTACRVFETLGIPVFYADDEAKKLMNSDASLRREIAALLGSEVYNHQGLDRAKVAAAVFGNDEKLAALNAIVHPATKAHGAAWFALQKAAYALKEAAILFESGSNAGLHYVIGVYAPKEIRLSRAMTRGNASREAIEARMAQQMDEEEKMKRCDFVLVNDNERALLPQILSLHQHLLAL